MKKPKGWATAMRAAVAAIEARVWGCPYCGEWFVKVGKQKYCTTRCATKAAWIRFQATRPTRDYAAEHARRKAKHVQ